jgi:hypothetical protein
MVLDSMSTGSFGRCKSHLGDTLKQFASRREAHMCRSEAQSKEMAPHFRSMSWSDRYLIILELELPHRRENGTLGQCFKSGLSGLL